MGRKPTLDFDTLLNKLKIGMVPDEEERGSAFPTDSDETTPETEEVQEKKEEKMKSQVQTFTLEDIDLLGDKGIWGHSFVLEGPSRSRICATIDVVTKGNDNDGSAKKLAKI